MYTIRVGILLFVYNADYKANNSAMDSIWSDVDSSDSNYIQLSW